MTLEHLEKLSKIGSLKPEPFSQSDFEALQQSARRRLADARNNTLSLDSRFDLAYNASHALGLAALRWHGYRAENRYIVFQCLTHTLQIAPERWRILGLAHRHRNVAEYDGTLDANESLVAGMIDVAEEMVRRLEALGTPPQR